MPSWQFLRCASIPKSAQAYPRVHKHTQGCANIPKGAQAYPRARKHTQGCASIPKGAQAYPRVHRHTQGCTSKCSAITAEAHLRIIPERGARVHHSVVVQQLQVPGLLGTQQAGKYGTPWLQPGENGTPWLMCSQGQGPADPAPRMQQAPQLLGCSRQTSTAHDGLYEVKVRSSTFPRAPGMQQQTEQKPHNTCAAKTHVGTSHPRASQSGSVCVRCVFVGGSDAAPLFECACITVPAVSQS